MKSEKKKTKISFNYFKRKEKKKKNDLNYDERLIFVYCVINKLSALFLLL